MVLAAKNAENAKNLFANFAYFAAKTKDLRVLKGNTMNKVAKSAILLPLAIVAAAGAMALEM